MNVLAGTFWSLAEVAAKSFTWEEVTPCIQVYSQDTDWKQV